MIWHIFKKDVRLTWHLAAAAAGLHWTTIAIVTIIFTGFYALKPPASLVLLLVGGLVATGLVIIATVQNDAIPGVRQDWLVRPIRRRDLILAKLLFAVLMVQLPVFLAGLGACLLSGFSLSTSLNAALQLSLVQMLVINLPFLAFASITRNLLDVVSGGVVIGLGVGIVVGLTPSTSYLAPLSRTGLSWIMTGSGLVVLVFGSAVVLALQYFRRRTRVGQILTACIVTLLLMTMFMPWRPAFALQKSLSSAPGSSRDISLSFDPAAGRYQRAAGSLTYADAASMLDQNDGKFRVYLPFRITGLTPDSGVLADHAEVRLIETTGRMERLELARWNVRREGSGASMDLVYPQLEIPAALYQRIKGQPVRLEVDHWLTLVRLASSYALPALAGKQQVPSLGQCRTKVNDGETAITLSCLQAGDFPTCIALFLEHGPTGVRNPNFFSCRSYSPSALNAIIPVSLSMSVAANLAFRDPRGLTNYPIDGSRLGESKAVIQVYRAQDHFSQMLVIPELRLEEWEAKASGI
jgi:hypothetical protein